MPPSSSAGSPPTWRCTRSAWSAAPVARTERLNLSGLTPAQRSLLVGDVQAAGTPILLAHGIIDNHTIFALMRRQLLRRGFTRIQTFSYSPLTLDVRSTAERMATEIERLCEESGSEQIHIVGHSLGGLIARYYVQRLGGANACTPA